MRDKVDRLECKSTCLECNLPASRDMRKHLTKYGNYFFRAKFLKALGGRGEKTPSPEMSLRSFPVDTTPLRSAPRARLEPRANERRFARSPVRPLHTVLNFPEIVCIFVLRSRVSARKRLRDVCLIEVSWVSDSGELGVCNRCRRRKPE